MIVVDINADVSTLPGLLRKLRVERRVSQLHLANEADVPASVVQRAELGVDARMGTWARLFEGLGYRLLVGVVELCEEHEEMLGAEAERRRLNRLAGLCAGKRRYTWG